MSENDAITPDTPDVQPTRGGLPRWLKWGLIGVVGVVVVGYGLIFLYAKVLNDSPDELDEGDLASALAVDDTTPDVAGDDGSVDDGTDDDETVDDETDDVIDSTDTTPGATDPPAPASTVPGTEAPPADEAPAGVPDGTSIWAATDASELGYRVKEILFGVDTEAVGRTNQITGGLTITGTMVTDGEFIVDVASISSDESRRDGQFRGRIMSTDEFPTAVFTLTEPIELGAEPGEGVEVTTTATGELTLRGVTNPVTFDLTARQEADRIGVLGNIPVVFADYQIANPSIGGITTEDNGLLEFVLVFEPA